MPELENKFQVIVSKRAAHVIFIKAMIEEYVRVILDSITQLRKITFLFRKRGCYMRLLFFCAEDSSIASQIWYNENTQI